MGPVERSAVDPDSLERLVLGCGDDHPLAREAIDGYREVLGDGHSYTIASVDILGTILRYQGRLREAGHNPITTEIEPHGTFYYAEEYHQQYLAKNPGGYCGIGGTGVSCA